MTPPFSDVHKPKQLGIFRLERFDFRLAGEECYVRACTLPAPLMLLVVGQVAARVHKSGRHTWLTLARLKAYRSFYSRSWRDMGRERPAWLCNNRLREPEPTSVHRHSLAENRLC